LGSKAYCRVYSQYSDEDSFLSPEGGHSADGWDSYQGGFRTDWNSTLRGSLTFEGTGYYQEMGNEWRGVESLSPLEFGAFNDIQDFGGADLLGIWKHTLACGSQMFLQSYVEHLELHNTSLSLNENTVDFDFQHHISLGARGRDLFTGGRVVCKLSPEPPPV
jgi:iron complex outermembrane recepter protein